MFFITGAVGFVTAGFFENLFGLEFLGQWTIILLFGICVLILAIGKYNILDSLIKLVAIILLVSSVSAFLLVLWNGPIEPAENFIPKELWTSGGILFLLALMGWMPWTLERMKQTNYRPKLKETLFEFRLAYTITAILAIMFVTLGSFIFFGSGEELPNNNADFAHKIITLYTLTIGEWSYLIIAAASFAVMFGTILAVFDGYSRSLQRTVELIFTKKEEVLRTKFRSFYILFLFVLLVGSLIVVLQFAGNLKEIVDFATVLSFMIAPIIAIFNFRLVTGKYFDKNMQPSVWLKVLSFAGILFLTGFAIYFLITRL
jgi:Mn2+/Fe2+ NRAMP family transporter